jgi:hypothetical protein
MLIAPIAVYAVIVGVNPGAALIGIAPAALALDRYHSAIVDRVADRR